MPWQTGASRSSAGPGAAGAEPPTEPPGMWPKDWNQRAPPQSPAECLVLLHLTHQGLGNDFGNQSEGDTVSSPLLLVKRNLLNTNLKDKSGYCACAVTAFPRNLNGILFSFFYYVPKYIFTQQRLQSTGGGRGGKALKIHYI